MSDARKPLSARTLRWLQRTPRHTFFLCALLVIAFEPALNRGRLTLMPSGAPLLAWGTCNIILSGNYRLPRAGGTAGMDAMPAGSPGRGAARKDIRRGIFRLSGASKAMDRVRIVTQRGSTREGVAGKVAALFLMTSAPAH